ncbi:hypothetical protein Ddye_004196 [Dipteronia dyeriana]|uniref:F-box associated beta-propeller type 1 domain-containing protein n=1 Tax=Dipteronia dyeriana TaxID=168575 RepID=A0AAE0CW03_9ROSI|nr:hypothetical protein Ddye_004196 [Dipteronia dyeriana]
MSETRRQKFLLQNFESLYHVDPETSSLMQKPSSSYRKVVPIKHDRLYKKEYDHQPFSTPYFWVSDSSNGLLLLCLQILIDPPHHEFFVYNPSTREFQKIPKLKSEKKSYDMVSTLHGFGYAESIDDYKFVRVFIKRKIIQIFSLRNNSWKTIKCDFPFNINRQLFRGSYGIPLNGAVHWVVDVFDYKLKNHSGQIVAFDFVKEKLKTLSILDRLLPLHMLNTFIMLGDYLCIINHLSEFWIMEEYGVEKSWTRISIPKKKKPYVGRCSGRNRGFLFRTLDDDGWLFGYEKDEQTYRPVVFDGIRSYNTYMYVENLVSPNFLTNVVTSDQGI